MGQQCCSSDVGSTTKGAQINTFDKLAQQNAKKSIKKNKKNRVSSYSSNETDTENESLEEKISCSPPSPVMDFNVIDIKFIDKDLKFAKVNKNRDILNQITKTLQSQRNGHIKSIQNQSMMECKSITTCPCIERTILSLKYIHNQDLDIINNSKDQTTLLEFVNNKHTNLLNDYHHILFQHEHDIDSIHNLLFTKYDISPCNINKCEMVKRNLRNRDREEKEKKISDANTNNMDLIFWMDIIDSIHCYLLHIYDYGYRGHNTTESEHTQKKHISEEIRDDSCVDISFAVLKENILSKRKMLKNMEGSLHRIDTHKFNIFTPNDDEKIESPHKLNKFGPFSGHNRKTKPDFNFGLKFYYWSYYKSKQEYVEGKYRDIKEEIMHNSYCKLSKYQYELIVNKAKKLLNTECCKTLKAEFIKDNHYNIDKGTVIKLENLIAMILYCDCELLSKALCSTFIASRSNEQLFAIKNRHREFRNWSKILRETIDLYGNITNTSDKYYIGSKYVTAPSMQIRFRTPTSMTKHIEIATRFIHDTDNGILLQMGGSIDNKTKSTKEIKSFDCKWLSNFNGESECVFIGGRAKLELNTVRILSINGNLGGYFRALHYFELLLNGIKISSVEASTITKYDYRFLSALIMREIAENTKADDFYIDNKVNKPERGDDDEKHGDINNDRKLKKLTRNGSGSKSSLRKQLSCKYIEDMFHSLCINRDVIIIDMILLNNYYPRFHKLIVHESIDNLVLLSYLCQLFPKCKRYAINATTEEYKMDLDLLLNEISKASCNKLLEEIHIRCRHIAGGSWLCNAWNTDLEYKYHSKKWKAKFEIGKGTNFDDKLILSKQKQPYKLQRSATMAMGKLQGNNSYKSNAFKKRNGVNNRSLPQLTHTID